MELYSLVKGFKNHLTDVFFYKMNANILKNLFVVIVYEIVLVNDLVK